MFSRTLMVSAAAIALSMPAWAHDPAEAPIDTEMKAILLDPAEAPIDTEMKIVLLYENIQAPAREHTAEGAEPPLLPFLTIAQDQPAAAPSALER